MNHLCVRFCRSLVRRHALLACTVLAAAMLTPSASLAGDDGQAVDVTVLEDTPQQIVLDYTFAEPERSAVKIDGQMYELLGLGSESLKMEAGAPAVPDVSRSVIIPAGSKMGVRVIDSQFYEIEDVDVAPSKGYILRTVDPADVPYTFGKTYEADAFYPGPLATIGEPYIMRDYRGLVVTVNPVQYNPVQRVLRVYTQMTVAVEAVGPGVVNVQAQRVGPRTLSRAFHEIYRSHFVNYGGRTRYDPLDETGDMLIISYDAWVANVQPLADHKNAVGMNTTIVPVSTIGNNASSIASYIQNLYDTSDLAFVLLVGDSTQVATPIASGGAADPTYALVAGTDNYPDIIVGRFSATTSAHVDTQVQRTVAYEQLPATQQDWFWQGMGVASDQGPGDDGEYDYVHIGYIRDDLLAHGYTLVDEIYDPYGTASQVSAALNAGRGIIDYCGHGSITSWGSTGFSVSNVNALTNDNMLPFIFDVACVNGQFNGHTCFAEAWMRATHDGQPTGAIGIYASSINQYWNPPMAAQDESVDLYCADQYSSYGTLCYAGACQMMDEYGSQGNDMFNTWHIFGDPSVVVFGTIQPPTGMRVAPSGGFASEGPNGGPFTPDSMIYTLTNHDATPIDYTAECGASWIELLNATGTIPAGGQADVTVSIASSAGSMGNGLYEDEVTFTNLTNHDGDTTRDVSLQVGVPELVYSFPMDSDPGWDTQGLWAFGHPTGNGGLYGNPDPTNGHTGTNVYGYNLNGDYENNLPERHLTSNAIDCTDLNKVSVKFWRWLGVETSTYDHAAFKVSTNGTTWNTIWENSGEVTDAAWSQKEYDISAIADGQSTLYLRWTMGTTDGSWQFCGWNIDDVEIWGVVPEDCPADFNGDGNVDSLDFIGFLNAFTAGC